MGDPAGIGPDIVISSWLLRKKFGLPPFFAIGEEALYAGRAAEFPSKPAFKVEPIGCPEEASSVFARALPVLPLGKLLGTVLAGSPSGKHAEAITRSIEIAVDLTLEGRASAIVTAPIAKHVLLQQGFAHAGHTEFLGELAGHHGFAENFPVMLMASEQLMAVPVTVHIPLHEVPSALTKKQLFRTAKAVDEGLKKYFAIKQPRLAVCGLNPHAGEHGELGREEIEIIAPAIAELNALGIRAFGPASADTLFHTAARQTYDAVLAMYHDQALIPFKTLCFEDGVNVTLGLPFIRTSPDHGTAFALAGTGRANPASFIAALRLAWRMQGATKIVRTRQQT